MDSTAKRTAREALCTAVVIFLVACFAILFPRGAYAAQTSDGFVYGIGNFYHDDGVVYAGTLDEYVKKIAKEHQEDLEEDADVSVECARDDYGFGFTLVERADADGALIGSGLGGGIDCGYGVYIYDYVGSQDNIVVPAKIDGVPVVAFTANFENQKALDVGSCSSIRYVQAENISNLLVGDNNANELKQIDLSNYEGKLEKLDLTPAEHLECLSLCGPVSGVSWTGDELRSLSAECGLDNLYMSRSSKLEELILDGNSLYAGTLRLVNCKSLKRICLSNNCLTSFEVNEFPNLKELNVEGNYIKDTDALEIWGAREGHELNCGGQRRPLKDLSEIPDDYIEICHDAVYNGYPIVPDVLIMTTNQSGSFYYLQPGVDYDWMCWDNDAPGTATVVIYGLGDYLGSEIQEKYVIKASSSDEDEDASSGTSKPSQTPPSSPAPGSQPSSPGPSTGASQATPSAVSASTTNALSKAKVIVGSRVYTAKTLKPSSVKVILNGKKLRAGIDYTVSCKGGKKIGSYAVTVIGKGAYTGTKTATFKIVPKGASIKKPVAAKKGLTVKWKAPSKKHLKQITGYKVQWSTDKKFKKSVKSKLVKGAKKTSLKVTKLKSKKTYYVRVCSYKKIGKAYYYSSWSKAKKVKVK